MDWLALMILAYLSDDPTLFLVGGLIGVGILVAAIHLYERRRSRKGRS